MAKRKARPGAVSPEEKVGTKRKARRKGRTVSRVRCNARCNARRNHKDGLFCRLFSDKENALSLYNALTGSSYTNADGLEIVTLEDAVYLSQKNDCAVCVQSSVALFEQQHRSYRAVDATAHSYEHALVHLLHSSIFSIGANALAANSSGTMTSLVSSCRHS